ncbi:adenylyltransferase/cytidyltransferase family protein [Candidatus Ruminimicrobium bovinum]|uniref:adenylyltransferase/cytidyltransferase family protein n=1 Tax=Candidatus Ruminimicrobium bovinum TaxID=3242779 RepID=UPI0039B8FF7D
MKNTSKRIITFGVFDMFHFGHLNLFKNIKKQFGHDSFLIVCVQSSECILKYKPNSKILYSTEERVKMVKNIKLVDDVKIYDDIDIDIQQIDFDVWVKGPDQEHSGFQKAIEYCKQNNKEIFIMNRTEGISSSYIKNIVGDFKIK